MSPINRSINDLPESGWAPDNEVRFAHLLAKQWQADGERERAEHVSSGALFIASDAGKCSRALAYRAADIPKSDPMDLTGYWNTTIGRWIHDQWQQAVEANPDVHALFEVEHWFLDGRGIVRIDALIELEKASPRDPNQPFTIAYEGKSVNGYGFKSAIGKVRRGTPAEGPRRGAVLQAAIGGLCADADEIVIGNWAKETLSGSTYTEVDAIARFVAEWSIPREQFEPVATQEIERVAGILELLESGLLASRKIPGVRGEIIDPTKGVWAVYDYSVTDNTEHDIIDTGSTWECNYCSWQTLCAQTPRGRLPVEQVVELRNALDHDPALNTDVAAAEEATWD